MFPFPSKVILPTAATGTGPTLGRMMVPVVVNAHFPANVASEQPAHAFGAGTLKTMPMTRAIPNSECLPLMLILTLLNCGMAPLWSGPENCRNPTELPALGRLYDLSAGATSILCDSPL